MIKVILVICLLVGCNNSKESPKQGSKNVPVYIPGRCPENQLLFPGEKPKDWFCDCGFDYIHHPTADGCFLPYRQGPCQLKEILVVPKNRSISECVENLCEKDGFVKYNGECYELNTQGPCKSSIGEEETFAVNKATLELGCLSKAGQLLNIIIFPPNCPPNSTRVASSCRPVY